jgi:hypothetical protein
MGILLLSSVSECSVKGPFKLYPVDFLISSNWIGGIIDSVSEYLYLVSGPIVDHRSFDEG